MILQSLSIDPFEHDITLAGLRTAPRIKHFHDPVVVQLAQSAVLAMPDFVHNGRVPVSLSESL
ncbi:hypothetical protein A9K76_08585 [Stenotrophomonas maltophilia]|nr:hypothetical protein A9K76_08585 [Stenotrophomonas maltophilia]